MGAALYSIFAAPFVIESNRADCSALIEPKSVWIQLVSEREEINKYGGALSFISAALCASRWGARAFVRPNSLSLNRSGPPRPTRYKNTTGLRRHVNNHNHTGTPTRRSRDESERKNPEKCMSNSERLSARISKVLQSQGEKKIIAHSAPRAFSVRFRTGRAQRHTKEFFDNSFPIVCGHLASQRLHLGVKTHKTKRKLRACRVVTHTRFPDSLLH
jgi:hypothetical protein